MRKLSVILLIVTICSFFILGARFSPALAQYTWDNTPFVESHWVNNGFFHTGTDYRKINTDNEVVNESFGVSTKIPGVEGAFAVVATDDIGGVYVAYQSHWEENSSEVGNRHVYFAYSHDYGANWSKSYRVNDNGSLSVLCDSPSIAIDQNTGHIFVAWKDNRTGVAKVYIDKSINRGVSFGADNIVHDWLHDYVEPWLPYTTNLKISDDGTIYIVWVAYYEYSFPNSTLFFTRSDDGGQTFNPPTTIYPMEGERFVHPYIAIENNDVLYVVYVRRNTTSASVYLTKSQNGGSSFGTPVTVRDVTTGRYCGGPKASVAVDGTIHVVWTDARAGDGTQYFDIYYATSEDGGLSFTPNLRVNDDLVATPPSTHPHFTRGAQGTPAIVTDSNSTVHVFWEDFRNFVTDTTYCRDIYYATKNETGFSTNLKVNYVHPDADSVNCADPNVALDSQDNFYVTYSDSLSGDNGHHSIYFMFVNTTKQPSESPSPIFGFDLIPILTALLIVLVFTQKKSKSSRLF
ncbi:MAG: sialidase family protein [Candidatus Hermodarchaeota archaeon]